MTQINSPPKLPLLIAGIPIAVEQMLRQSGVPIARCTLDSANSDTQRHQPGSIVLFDSNNAVSHREVWLAERNGLATIDVAPLLAGQHTTGRARSHRHSPSLQNSKVGALVERLKQQVEARGGVWIRVGDYPYPYQSAVFLPNDTNHGIANGDAGVAAKHDDPPPAWLQHRYSAGLPIIADDPAVRQHMPTNFFHPDNIRDTFPLLWRTSREEFGRWWRCRMDIQVQAWSQDRDFQIQTSGQGGGFRPTLELWIGDHMASLPLTPGLMSLHAHGIVFVRESERNPGGLTADSDQSHFTLNADQKLTSIAS